MSLFVVGSCSPDVDAVCRGLTNYCRQCHVTKNRREYKFCLILSDKNLFLDLFILYISVSCCSV